MHRTSESRGFGLGHLLDLAQDVPRPEIVDCVHRVDPEPIDVEVANPHPHVVEHVGPHGVAAGVVVVDGPAPGCVIAIGEVWAEVADVGPLGTKVVVDDVDKDGQTDAVTGGHQPLQAPRSAVRVLDGKRMREVVAPTAAAGKLTDGHQLDGRHAQTMEVIEAGGQRVEGPFGRKGAHVQLVEHQFGAGQTLPRSFGPVELVEPDHR